MLDFIHFKLNPFLAVPRLQTGSQTFSDVQHLTDIKKSLEKILHATTIATQGFQKMDKVERHGDMGLIIMALARLSAGLALSQGQLALVEVN